MSRYLGKSYECEGCGRSIIGDKPWKCYGCGEEVCLNCFDRYGMCEKCVGDMTDEEALKFAIERGYDIEGI
jgi:hypothetical protein